MFNDSVIVNGDLTIVRYGEDGIENFRQTINNLVVSVGKNWIAARLTSTPPAVMTHMAIGSPSGVSAPLLTDTTLTTEIARVALTVSGGVASTNTVTYTAGFPAGTGTSTSITEAGLFNGASGSTMLCRTAFSSVSKSAIESIGISWTLTIN